MTFSLLFPTDTVVKHQHWDLEDDVRIGGTIVNQSLTVDEVKLKEESSHIFICYPYMYPCYSIFFQFATSCIVSSWLLLDFCVAESTDTIFLSSRWVGYLMWTMLELPKL